LGRKVTFARSLINKGKHQNFKKKHFLIHLETFTQSLYLSAFQRLGRKVTFAKSLINKGKHQNFKKETFSYSFGNIFSILLFMGVSKIE